MVTVASRSPLHAPKKALSVRDAKMVLVGAVVGAATTLLTTVTTTVLGPPRAQDGARCPPTSCRDCRDDIGSRQLLSKSKRRHQSREEEWRRYHRRDDTVADDDADDGTWNAVHVYGGTKAANAWSLYDEISTKRWLRHSPRHSSPEGKKWFGQHGQDIAVQKILCYKSNGFFVDLAANDPVWASNTFALEQNFDWRGLCVEPNQQYWPRLSAYRRSCKIVGAVAGAIDGQRVNVTLSHKKEVGPFGGIIGPQFDNRRVSSRHSVHQRYTVSLETILHRFRAPSTIDYLSLDVEGAEEFILGGFDFDRYTFSVMTVERPSDSLRELLVSHGYAMVMPLRAGDTVWVHSSLHRQATTNLKVNPEDIANHAVVNFPPGVLDER